MKFLLDQDVYALTVHFLREQGHDVVTASELGMSRAQDEQLLKTAGEMRRIFVTRDRDYGNLVFRKPLGSGVIYLRVSPSELNEVHVEVEKVLSEYTEEDLSKLFVVVEVESHRVRKIER
jgi:predicted nuclease of predicted toxin-antitoxin system